MARKCVEIKLTPMQRNRGLFRWKDFRFAQFWCALLANKLLVVRHLQLKNTKTFNQFRIQIKKVWMQINSRLSAIQSALNWVSCVLRCRAVNISLAWAVRKSCVWRNLRAKAFAWVNESSRARSSATSASKDWWSVDKWAKPKSLLSFILSLVTQPTVAEKLCSLFELCARKQIRGAIQIESFDSKYEWLCCNQGSLDERRGWTGEGSRVVCVGWRFLRSTDSHIVVVVVVVVGPPKQQSGQIRPAELRPGPSIMASPESDEK